MDAEPVGARLSVSKYVMLVMIRPLKNAWIDVLNLLKR
jgi:hypothetical protein